jgi:hypothetical protein
MGPSELSERGRIIATIGAVPSDAEHCRAQVAECRRKAEETSDPSAKNELREIANYWDELRSAYEAIERSKRSD